MKQMIKSTMRRLGQSCVGTLYEDIIQEVAKCRGDVEKVAQRLANVPHKASQIGLYLSYREMARRNAKPLPTFAEVGFRCHSQFEEDGILLFIFGLIGTTNRTCVEICAGNGAECNTTNLILNHGWWGYLFDGNEQNVKDGIEFFRRSPEAFQYPPRFKHAWITAENVNDLLRDEGVGGSIDLLSLDIDGMDYWVWKALDRIAPRVVVCETQNAIGADEALTTPYDGDFRAINPRGIGASLAAMTKVGAQKGYRLVGTHRYGFNAFFIREGIGEELLPAVSPASCLEDPYTRSCQAEVWPMIKRQAWERV
jgi:hypothetical protein